MNFIVSHLLLWDYEVKYFVSNWGWGCGDLSEVEEDNEEQGAEGRQDQAGQGRAAGQIRAEKISPNDIDE